MATFRITVLKHQRRRDGKYPVSVCVTHLRKKAYINTGYYVGKSRLSRSFELRDSLILSELLRRIEEYERKLVLLGRKADNYSARELADIVSAKKGLDFTAFFSDYIVKLKREKSTISCYKTCFAHLENFKPVVSLSGIDGDFLNDFLFFLEEKEVGKRGQQLYLTLLKSVYREAQKKYRKDTGEAVDDAFEDFVIPAASVPKKRNLSAEKIRELFVFSGQLEKKHEFARDVFFISFLLCGTNTIDIFNLEKEKDGRLSYNRSKTAGRRKDNAFISYRIEPELRVYLEKYAGKEKAFDFCERYQNHVVFNKTVTKSLKFFVEKLELTADFSTYYARHSWATIARNRCGVSRDDISACLNHSSRVVTDDYIELDNSVIDNANRRVINFLFKQE